MVLAATALSTARHRRSATDLMHLGQTAIVGTIRELAVAGVHSNEQLTLGTSRRAGQTVECGWCGAPVVVPARGRIPSWCSSSCRHRAWESRRANREETPEVRFVTRIVEVESPVIRTVETPTVAEPHSAQEWADVLELLATRLAQGRIYRRDLPTLEPAVRRLVDVWIRTFAPPR